MYYTICFVHKYRFHRLRYFPDAVEVHLLNIICRCFNEEANVEYVQLSVKNFSNHYFGSSLIKIDWKISKLQTSENTRTSCHECYHI